MLVMHKGKKNKKGSELLNYKIISTINDEEEEKSLEHWKKSSGTERNEGCSYNTCLRKIKKILATRFNS